MHMLPLAFAFLRRNKQPADVPGNLDECRRGRAGKERPPHVAVLTTACHTEATVAGINSRVYEAARIGRQLQREGVNPVAHMCPVVLKNHVGENQVL